MNTARWITLSACIGITIAEIIIWLHVPELRLLAFVVWGFTGAWGLKQMVDEEGREKVQQMAPTVMILIITVLALSLGAITLGMATCYCSIADKHRRLNS